MSKLLTFVSATFVLIFMGQPALATPEDQMPNSPPQQESWPEGPPSENLTVSKPPLLSEAPPAQNARYYPYRQAFTIRGGQARDFSDFPTADRVFGLQYQMAKFLSPKWEFGTDMHEHGIGHIYAGLRWVAWERSYFRPSVKIGADHMVNSAEGMASFTHVDNYYFRATATLEYVVWNPYSIRLEPELLLGFKNAVFEFTLGVSRGW